ncbi:hypothetical protein WA1_40830 [Scytonema hofmannii PCC 7110]|uniref:Uncharacterized protein n=1 Tax=Scytonema hofmannii PCC 7110 TaxID=128403 RepID=A0A139WUK6_9CYAN|nr:DUF4157 domain-containing protein [Scytonema hofmannii]KYC36087.1 hypothetical protein WA1_40830 [Scytonema hofmannii PCC 7110]
MHTPKLDKNVNTKLDPQQTAAEKSVSSHTQRDPLVQQISRMGNAPNPSAHAAVLNRAPANQQSSNRQLLLQLQQQYGNPYVNQVLQLAREMGGKTSASPTQIKPKTATLQRQESPEEEKDEQPVQTKPEIATLQRQESPEEEKDKQPVQTKSETATPQPQESPEEEKDDQPVQTKPETATSQQKQMPPKEDEEEDKTAQTKPEISTLQRQEMPPKEDEEEDKTAQTKPPIQAKLTINPAGDKYEQEADRVADQVVQRMNTPAVERSPESGAIQPEDMPEQVQKKPEISTLQRQEMPQEDEEHKLAQKQPQSAAKKSQNKTVGDKKDKLTQQKPKIDATQQQQQPEKQQQDKLAKKSSQKTKGDRQKTRVQMKSANQHQSAEANMAGTQDLEGSIQQAQGSGQPIPEKTRQPLEQQFGSDFSGVKIHTNTQSDQLNKSIQARAFTTGQNVFFRQGAYDPSSQSGQKLLAHELTHVVQQNGSAVQAKSVSTKSISKKENKVQTKPLVTPSSSQPEPIIQCKELNSPETTEPDNKQSPKEQEQTKPDNKQEPTQPIPPAGDTAQGQGQPSPASTAGGGAASASQGESGNDAGATTAPVMAEAGTSPITGEQKAPASPQEDPAFQAVTSNAQTVAKEQQEHQPAEEKAEEAQAAAEPPTNEVDSKAQANQVGEMQQTETPEFDAAAFKAKLMERIADMAPKTLEEADEFKNDNKLDSVKEELGDKVNEEQKNSQGPLDEKTKETPDTSGIEPKTVEPLPPTEPGEAPTDINAQNAAPKSKGESEVEAPLQEDSKKLDKQMADADVTEEQLAKSNEPEFQATLQSKGEAQTNAQEAPPKYREDEQGLISKAEGAAVATAQEQMQGMHDTRVQQFGEVADKQAGTKGKDEEARTKVATDINKIYEDTKAKVEKTLSDLDTQVEQEFDAGAADAKKAFEDYVDQRMKKYKDKRYGGAFGWLLWIGDKLFGMPSEVNAFYEEGRDLYIQKMNGVIDKVVTIISQGLTQAKAEIANGKQEIQNYLDKLPEDLQEVGQEAAADIESKFEDLQQTVSDKEDELINTLSQKYQENLKEIDDRIKEMKEQNKGLIQKAIEFIVNTIKTIIELGKLLLQVLARVAKVIPQILKDPIGFFKNLVKAIKQGFENFVKNIAQHLKEGLISWLTGTLAGTGIEMPKAFDPPGIFSLVTQVLGLTAETIQARATERLEGGTGERSQPADATKQGKQGKGETKGGQATQTPQAGQTPQTTQAGQGRDATQNTAQNSPVSSQTTADNGNQENSALADTGFDIFKILSTQGVAGLWELVKDKIGDLKAMVLDPIQNFVIESVIKAGIEWIIGLMNPASAFLKACKAIYEIIKFFIERAKQITDLINAILDSVEAIAKGAIDQAVKMVEGALAKAVPVVIGFLASLLGLGGIAEKVQAIIQKLQRPIEKAIDGVIDLGVKAANKVNKNKGKNNKPDEKTSADKDKSGKQNKGKDNKPDEKPRAGQDKGGKSDQRTRDENGKDNKEKATSITDKIVEWWKTKKQFKDEENETHTLFFQGKDKSAKLMVASSQPQLLNEFLKRLEDPKHEKNKTNNKANKYTRDTDSKKALLEEMKNLAAQVDAIKANTQSRSENKNPNLPKSYTENTGKEINDLLQKITNKLKDFYQDVGKKDKDLPQTKVSFPKQKEQMIPLTQNKTTKVKSVDGEEMVAEPLSIKPGDTVGSQPTGGSTDSELVKQVTERNRGGQVYVRGHLLNHHVHGPGNDYRNLTTITNSFNTKEMEKKVETYVKDLVLKQKKVLSYKVTVEYGGHGKRTHIPAEEYLATKIKFEINQMQKKKGRSGANQDDWQINNSPKTGRIPNYPPELPHELPNDDSLDQQDKPSINIGTISADNLMKDYNNRDPKNLHMNKEIAKKITDSATKNGGKVYEHDLKDSKEFPNFGDRRIEKLRNMYSSSASSSSAGPSTSTAAPTAPASPSTAPASPMHIDQPSSSTKRERDETEEESRKKQRQSSIVSNASTSSNSMDID